MLRRHSIVSAVLTVLSLAGPGFAGTSLVTAPVDYSLYREGEVRRVEKYFGKWLLTCDVIQRLGQKFCSMRSVARAANGTTIAAVTISTDDHGQPAAIVTLPYGTSIKEGLAVSFARPGTNPKTSAVTLRPSQCGGLGCQVIWLIAGRDIGDLRLVNNLRLTFRMAPGEPKLTGFTADPPMTTIDGRLDMTGFSDALEASMH